MANTTNFNWETPDDTDLVKDGAAAMRTLGNSIDTSFVDLKGGTTGQILSKASNTDLDYTWVTTDDANAIQNAIVDAKGDLIAASAADTPARLAVGSNGETLVADSSTSTGLRYQTPKTQNAVYNSGFDVWQRGTTSTANATAAGNGYSADRWQSIYTSASMTTSQQATGDTTNLPNIRYCARVQRNSGQTSTQNIVIVQTLETADSIRFAGQTITFSYYARKGANFSATSNILNAVVNQGTGTDQNSIYSFTSSSNVSASTATLTTTWQRFQATATVAAGSTEIGFYIYYTPTGTAGVNDYFEITGVQLETGSIATPFNRQSGSIQGELSACQRYYIRQGGDTAFQTLASGYGASTTTAVTTMTLPVKMRVAPTSVDFSTIRVHNTSAGYAITAVALDANFNSSFQPVATSTIGSASLTIANGYIIGANNSTSAYLGFSAEL
jgi:hypothetical protein